MSLPWSLHLSSFVQPMPLTLPHEATCYHSRPSILQCYADIGTHAKSSTLNHKIACHGLTLQPSLDSLPLMPVCYSSKDSSNPGLSETRIICKGRLGELDHRLALRSKRAGEFLIVCGNETAARRRWSDEAPEKQWRLVRCQLVKSSEHSRNTSWHMYSDLCKSYLRGQSGGCERTRK